MSAVPKDGTGFGDVRTPLDTTKLIPYLEANVPGYAGPLTVKQFGVSSVHNTPADSSLASPTRRICCRRRPETMCSAAPR